MNRTWFAAFALAVVGCGATEKANSVVVYGDSFSAGSGSDLRAPELWPSKLERVLRQRDGGWRVSNRSINGNGLVWRTRCFGEPALDRLRADLDRLPRNVVIVLMAGVNDTIQPNLPAGFSPCFDPTDWPPEKITARLQTVADNAPGRRIIVATIPPFAASEFHSVKAEDLRLKANQWIRSHWKKGDIIDLDRVLADGATPPRLRAGYDSGDGLHPNERGATAIATNVAEMVK